MKKWKIAKSKMRDALIVSFLALLLVFAVWKIFYTPSSAKETSLVTESGQTSTEREKSLAALLSQIEGVGEAEVRICETEDSVQSVVVVCDGARNILVNINVCEAVSAALGVKADKVKIYPKK